MRESNYAHFAQMLHGLSLFMKKNKTPVLKYEAFHGAGDSWLQTAQQILDNTHPEIGFEKKDKSRDIIYSTAPSGF